MLRLSNRYSAAGSTHLARSSALNPAIHPERLQRLVDVQRSYHPLLVDAHRLTSAGCVALRTTGAAKLHDAVTKKLVQARDAAPINVLQRRHCLPKPAVKPAAGGS
jgi:hypothetical protein